MDKRRENRNRKGSCSYVKFNIFWPMAVWKATISNYVVKINNVDHAPPHCHVTVKGRNVQVVLADLTILKPPPHSLPANLRNGLKDKQEEMFAAWSLVKEIPAGGNPQF